MLEQSVFVSGACVIVPRWDRQRGWASMHVEPEGVLGVDRCRRLDPMSQMALVVVEHARAQAGLTRSAERTVSEDEAVVVGSALAATVTSVRYARRLVTAGPAATNPIDFPDSIDGAPAAHVALDLGLGGVSLTLTTGELSAAQALVQAARLVAWGRAKRAHLVVGDRCDPFFVDALVREAKVDDTCRLRHCNAECMLAVVMESRSALEQRGLLPSSAIEVTGFVAHSGNERVSSETPARYAWELDPDGIPRIKGAAAAPGSLLDPSGALDLAAALVAVAGPTCRVIGAGEPEVLAPFAQRAACGKDIHPDLAFVRRS
jgi:hypothetical protein